MRFAFRILTAKIFIEAAIRPYTCIVIGKELLRSDAIWNDLFYRGSARLATARAIIDRWCTEGLRCCET
ncbi:hypothetical protein HLB23_03090 [Nocardia uniformis]|uniref:Uncharacterized protein n=1 Tax=Nocardia uniformis TaxID=53432 RepID=A0A849BX47_9NOCA|nr:hypothetical protein [Nocardia uniformis]NNH68870.1 hypothetical protein [Nocardia uniformis]